MRSRILIYIWISTYLFSLSRNCIGQPNSFNGISRNIEHFFQEYDRQNVLDAGSNVPDAPTFIYEAKIDSKTTLRRLKRIRREVDRKLGLTLEYRNIEYGSSGLRKLKILAKTKSKIYPALDCIIDTNSKDFGIFEVSYGVIRWWFIGTKSDWKMQLNSWGTDMYKHQELDSHILIALSQLVLYANKNKRLNKNRCYAAIDFATSAFYKDIRTTKHARSRESPSIARIAYANPQQNGHDKPGVPT